MCSFIWALTQETLILLQANNKGADQPVQSHSLISPFVICFLDCIITPLATCKIATF